MNHVASLTSSGIRTRRGGALVLTLLLTLLSSAWAQLTYRGDVTFAVDATLSEAFPAQVGWTVTGNLDAEYPLEPLTLRLMLDPSVRFAPEGTFDLGLTELYARLPLDHLDMSVGLERLPLEYARLSLPFTLEPVSGTGVRRGVPGVRVVWFPDDWRVRAGVLIVEERVTPAVSVKRSFGDFELEVHALYSGQGILGLGGSGLLSSVVLYGETWLLTSPFDARAALGVTGFAGDSLWTVEGLYAPSPVSPTAHPQVLGQLSLPQGEDASWLFQAGLGLLSEGIGAQASATYSRTLPDQRQLAATLGGQTSPSITAITLRIGITDFF